MIDWHARYLQQAAWTRPLREYLFKRAGLARARRVLEVGCGTGAILSDLTASSAFIHGLDRDLGSLTEAQCHAAQAHLTCGDALALPFYDKSFDVTFCHYLLLWVADPLRALLEMKRLTRPGGAILALAEPDYAGRVDRPEALAPLGRWQSESLRRQGANPDLGSHLANLFAQAGLKIVETGTLGGQEGRRPSPAERDLEWAVLEADLAGFVPAEEITRLKAVDERAWVHGERRLYVPTYFAYGQVP
jgi:SAM-dependent methyltransferase